MNTEDTIEVGANTVREWARKQGLEVGARGHLPQNIIETFNRRHRKQRYTNRNPWLSK